MFFRFLLIVWTGLHLYVFWRASSVPFIKRHISRKILFIIMALLWVSFLLPRWFENISSSGLGGAIEFVTMDWLGILFLVFICLLLIDIITIFGLILKNYVSRLRTAALLGGVLLSIMAIAQGMRPPVINDYDIQLTNLPTEDDGLVLAVISDTHVGSLISDTWLEARIAQINEIKPDMVLLLGDLFEGDNQNERSEKIVSIFRKLSAPLGVWGVTGNHDFHSNIDSSLNFCHKAGINLLRNDWKEIRPGLVLGGVDDGHEHGRNESSSDRLRQLLSAKPLGAASILMSHRPQGVEEAAAAGVGLMLSGHTHGGQIWPFSYISGYVNRLLAGEYIIDGMPIIVTRGAGTWGPRMRLWAPGEILRITLHSQN